MRAACRVVPGCTQLAPLDQEVSSDSGASANCSLGSRLQGELLRGCLLVWAHLYSRGLTSAGKPIWKVTATLKLFQDALDSFAELATLLEGKGIYSGGTGGWMEWLP